MDPGDSLLPDDELTGLTVQERSVAVSCDLFRRPGLELVPAERGGIEGGRPDRDEGRPHVGDGLLHLPDGQIVELGVDVLDRPVRQPEEMSLGEGVHVAEDGGGVGIDEPALGLECVELCSRRPVFGQLGHDGVQGAQDLRCRIVGSVRRQVVDRAVTTDPEPGVVDGVADGIADPEAVERSLASDHHARQGCRMQ